MLQPHITWLCLFCLLGQSLASANELPTLEQPNKLSGSHILVLYKQGDTVSKQIAHYYAQRRHVPNSQLAAVELPRKTNQLSPEQFATLTQQLTAKLTESIKVILLTWHTPYRVGCMSITSAFAVGFDEKYCGQLPAQKTQCNPTAISPYYNDQSGLLWQQASPFRLSMVLSAETFQQAKALIDRGIVADTTYPKGHAYLVKTHDRARSTRAPIFKRFADIWQQHHNIHAHFIDDSAHITSTSIKYKTDILFYQTGLKQVPDIETNHYLPGAIADHLTSGAGVGIAPSGQMKAFRWLDSGVTGSYGAVIEPCNFTEKFPNPHVLIPSYASGDSLIEAYWKSVQQPGEGLFIGEPLARPWNKTRLYFQGTTLVINTEELDSTRFYFIQHRQSPDDKWVDTPDEGITFKSKNNHIEIHLPQADAAHYRIIENAVYPDITELPEY